MDVELNPFSKDLQDPNLVFKLATKLKLSSSYALFWIFKENLSNIYQMAKNGYESIDHAHFSFELLIVSFYSVRNEYKLIKKNCE